jgi:hypothetical protein
MLNKITTIFLLAGACLLAGCASSTQSEIKLANPEAGSARHPVTKSTVVLIRSVTDERTFKESPRDPSTPSLDAAQASATTKAHAVGRKRNAAGKAMAAVLLENGQTVASVVRDNLVVAFRQAGFRTTTNPAEAGATAMVVDVRIRRFWAWSNPGVWQGRLNANITTSLDTNRGASQMVSVDAENASPTGADSTWTALLDQALKDYRMQVGGQFSSLP